MKQYSPIKKIYVKNFRNIGEAIIDFEESPIVSLVGDNEAGKTSIIKAFSVCALHAHARDQKDFIRDGTKMFGVAIELEDGTLIQRMKTADINKYEVKMPDGTMWDTNKIDSGLPAIIQDIMGLIEEPETKEYLQIRTYENQLLFVVTPSSTNYKVMYDALKVNQVSKAIILGSKEANSLKQEIYSNELGIFTLTSSLRKVRIEDISPLIAIKNRLISESNQVKQLDTAYNLLNSIGERKKQLGVLSELVEHDVNSINELETTNIINTCNTIKNIDRLKLLKNRYTNINTIDKIDIDSYSKLTATIKTKESISILRKLLDKYVVLNDTESIDIFKIQNLLRVYENYKDIKRKKEKSYLKMINDANIIEQSELNLIDRLKSIIILRNKIKNLKSTYDKINVYCTDVEKYLKAIGVAIEICPNCGESVVIDIEKVAM